MVRTRSCHVFENFEGNFAVSCFGENLKSWHFLTEDKHSKEGPFLAQRCRKKILVPKTSE